MKIKKINIDQNTTVAMAVKGPAVRPLDVPTADEFQQFSQALSTAFRKLTDMGRRPLFRVADQGLFDLYLIVLPGGNKQFHTCNACRRFIDTYGSLVVVEPDGSLVSAIWDPRVAHPYYRGAIQALKDAVERKAIEGVFLTSETAWGVAKTGSWTHLAVEPSAAQCWRQHNLKTAGQAMAEKREDFRNVARALSEFSARQLGEAVNLLTGDALYGAPHVLGAARWLHGLAVQREALHPASPAWQNTLWLAVAEAPAGFCHPRSGMLATLLDDIQAGLPFSEVARRFADKMAPTRYQRPTAAPKEGAIDRAEAIFQSLGLTAALDRRQAGLPDIQSIWWPTERPAQSDPGVFGHLRGKAQPASQYVPPTEVITFRKFVDTVLPDAQSIQYRVPSTGNFGQYLTANDPSAPPILKWGNPVSWYVYPNVSPANRWGLRAGETVDVLAVSLKPPQWNGEQHPQFDPGALFVLRGAADTNEAGSGLFPVILRGDLHEVRSVIEAHSNARPARKLPDQTAAGILLQGGAWGQEFSVETTIGTRRYRIDRWD